MAVRKTVTVEANGEEHIVRELTVYEIISFVDGGGKVAGGDEKADGTIGDLLTQFDELMAISIPGVKIANFTDPEKTWAPSEIKKLFDAFREVNTVFFEVAQRLGLTSLLGELEKAVAADFSQLLASSLKQAMPKP